MGRVRSIRSKSAGPGKVIGVSVGAKSAGPAKVIGYSVQPVVHLEPSFPMRELSGSEFPMRQQSGPEFPIRQLSGSEFPMRQLSGSEILVQGTTPSIVSPRCEYRQVETVSPSIVSPRLDDRQVETRQPVLVDNTAHQSSNKLALYEDDVEDKTKHPAKLIDDDYEDKVKPCFHDDRPEAPMLNRTKYTDPFLTKYFAAVHKRAAGVDFVNLGLDFLLGTAEKIDQIKLDDKQWYEHEAKPLLIKSFRLYDTSGADIVKKDEAALLFSSLTSEDSDAVSAFASIAAEYSIRARDANNCPASGRCHPARFNTPDGDL